MSKINRKNIGYKKERVVLSDVLPYEVPPFFSNRHFYNFLVENKVKFEDNRIYFRDKGIGSVIKLLFGLRNQSIIIFDSVLKLNYFQIKPEWLKTIPFKFKISHKKNDYRELTIIHPLNQLSLIPFYDKYNNDILYHSSRSPFSLRKPTKVASLKYFKDSTHNKNRAKDSEIQMVETSDKEYVSLKTYFSYSDYSNIYKFYEDHKFHRAEKQFDTLLKFDISRCFDSIYTHSLPWALLNKRVVKDNIKAVNNSFGGKFDKAMQLMNYNETNGIIIGPEFSRIYAELILQKVDSNVQNDLTSRAIIYKIDYDIYRYVDDFFVFYNELMVKDEILALYKVRLQEYNLFFNDSKTEVIEKPIITQISIAKEEIRELLEKTSIFRINRSNDNNKIHGVTYNTANDIITNYKKVLSLTKTSYKDLQNYFLAAIFNKTKSLINSYQQLEQEIVNGFLNEKSILEKLEIELSDTEKEKLLEKHFNTSEKLKQNIIDINKIQKSIDRKFVEIIDLTFFIYSVLPRVSYSIKVCHIMYCIIAFIQNQEIYKSKLAGSNNIKFILDEVDIGLSFDKKHNVFKAIYDGINIVLKKNRRLRYSEVETLYLLAVLGELGDNYRFSEKKLLTHFQLNSDVECTYFLIVSLFHYIKDKRDYWELRKELKKQIKSKLRNFDGNNAEQNILLLDLLSCPYIEVSNSDSVDYKIKLLNQANFFSSDTLRSDKVAELNAIIAIQDNWFVKWDKVDLGRELNTKRGHEVY